MEHSPSNQYCRSLTVSTRADLDRHLDDIVEEAIQEALRHPGRGVLITRRTDQELTVELSQAVPFGVTLEQDLREQGS